MTWLAGRPRLPWVVLTVAVVAAIEIGRRAGFALPIPFLLLYASVVATAGAGGLLAGCLSGAVASGFVIYCAIVGFGPATLTGGVLQVLFGVALYVGTGALIGRLRNQRDGYQTAMEGREAELTRRLERLSARFESLAQNAPMVIILKGLDDRFQAVNRRFAEWYGIPEQDMVGKLSHDVFPKPIADGFVAQDHEVIRTRQVIRGELDVPFADGSIHTISLTKFPVFDASGTLVGVGAINTDVTEQKRAAEALRVTQDRFAAILEQTSEAIIAVDGDARITLFNKGAETCFGYRAEEVVGQPIDLLLPDGLPAAPDGDARLETTGRRKSGEAFPASATIANTDLGGGAALSIMLHDITEQKAIEQQLLQAQKMEAVGQLTGGIAHDFNNLLTVVLGNVELLANDLPEDDGNRRLVQPIMRAANRGAELTQRLLAFSRRQTLRAEVLDLGKLADEMHELLDRTLGETIDVRIVADDGLWPAMADRAQVESALLNLAINARDAMPDGGTLTIECRNVRIESDEVADDPDALAGEYAMIAVSDTGTGMAEAVRKRAFEPFFTTKDVGQGSGLGLSMVYGFAKQSGGHAAIESAPNEGTVVRLYLPRAVSARPAAGRADDSSLPRGQGQHVLVLEDDPEVRGLTVQQVGSLGYRVTAAGSAAEAETALAREDTIELVLSDVVLPGGVSGPRFAVAARARNPQLRVIFMSGYTADAVDPEGGGDGSAVLLTKPFKLRELAGALRDAFGA